MVEMLNAQEAEDVNLIPASEIDRQVMLGNWYPVVISSGKITGIENAETPAAGTVGVSM